LPWHHVRAFKPYNNDTVPGKRKKDDRHGRGMESLYHFCFITLKEPMDDQKIIVQRLAAPSSGYAVESPIITEIGA